MKIFPVSCLLTVIACLVDLVPPVFAATGTAPRPNILWLTSEDNNVDWIGCYGNPFADTPHIDQLAREGFRYLHAFANAPVCAPSRSTWITGVQAVSTGTQPMRSRYAIPHDRIGYYPDYLRAHGYFVGNSTKTDYNIGGREDAACWDNPGPVRWDELPRRQPFFQVINFMESHESRAQGDVSSTRHDPARTTLREFHPDLINIRRNYAKYYDAVQRMDADVGAALQRLEDLGLADDTIVIYNSDHGGVMPLSKRFLFRTSLHCPLIVRIPEKFKHLWPAAAPGATVDRLVSFIDMPKTWLSLTGAEVPEVMQGKIFLGPATEPEPPFHFAFRGRMDERIDNARAVADKRYLYIRNYMPFVPWMQHLTYLWLMTATVEWDHYVQSGQATELQSRHFRPKGGAEELYDMESDPDNVHNLAADPAYAERLQAMRGALHDWQLQIFDSGLLPESERVRLAAAHDVTIYDAVRHPEWYPLPDLLAAADLALEANPARLPRLRALLGSSAIGLRYWGMVGCFLLQDEAAGERGLEDASDEVRALAAWLLIRAGRVDEGVAALDQLLRAHSYATLTVLNIVDLIGDVGERLMPTVRSETYVDYAERMREQLLEKFPQPDASL